VENLHILKDHTVVDLVQPQLGWPDMVFYNAGLVLGHTVVLSRFHKERQGEEPFFKHWFEDKGYTCMSSQRLAI